MKNYIFFRGIKIINADKVEYALSGDDPYPCNWTQRVAPTGQLLMCGGLFTVGARKERIRIGRKKSKSGRKRIWVSVETLHATSLWQSVWNTIDKANLPATYEAPGAAPILCPSPVETGFTAGEGEENLRPHPN